MAFPTLYFAQRIHLWIKSKKGKAKGTWNSPSPDYYQTSVMKVLHRFTVTRSNFKNKEELSIKSDPTVLMHQGISGGPHRSFNSITRNF